jgi:hypothetical protein
MRSTIGFAILVVTSLFARRLSANEPEKSESPAECNSPSALAFGKAIKGVLAQYEQSGRNQQELSNKDANFREWVANPKSMLADFESYVRCNPIAPTSELQLATVALQCLDFGSYLDYLKRLSQATKSEAAESALFYALAPGFLRSNAQLVAKNADPSVKSTLKVVAKSPNASPALRRMIIEILDGSAKKALKANPVKPLLSCESGTRAPNGLKVQ